MQDQNSNSWLDTAAIAHMLEARSEDPAQINAILQKARELKGLTLEEVACLSRIDTPAQIEELFATARFVKESIYGRRMVLFAPLYISNLCGNECSYCAFSSSNKEIARHSLSMAEIQQETAQLIEQGQKRLLLVAGEGYPAAKGGFQYVLDSIAAVYEVSRHHGNIRRVNINVAPLSVEEFTQLQAAGIGTYQLFQETYHRPTYTAVHTRGRKADFDWRASAMDRAMQAGIDDVGLGVLFGLYDWRFELLSLLQHNAHLEATFGVGCHTISVPRLEPADNAPLAATPPARVSDADFKKIIAILRLAVPYTGIILSTRESGAMRRECYELGVSQISAGSRTNPGGYSQAAEQAAPSAGQFQLGDHRSLEEIVAELADMGLIPSFCTACYRLGRTGQDFMDLAKPGLIRKKCDPNAVTTFLEYLIDYGCADTMARGEVAIACELEKMDDKVRAKSVRMLEKIRSGKRDIFC